MPQTCSICTNKKRSEIDKLLLNGDSLRGVARSFRVSEDALNRHKQKHISKALVSAQQAREVLRADDLLGQVRSYLEKTDGIFQAVSSGKGTDHRTALLALREAREYLKLLLEVQGELQPDGRVNVRVVFAQYKQELNIVMGVLDELAPDARQKIVARLEEFRAGQPG